MKSGHAALLPLTRCQYESTSALTPAIDGYLHFLRGLMTAAAIDAAIHGIGGPAHKLTVFSDAFWKPQAPLLRGFGIVAFIAFLPNGSTVYAPVVVPQELLALFGEREKYINPLETLALCGTYFSLPINSFAGCAILHFGDNTGANFGAIRGYSPCHDVGLMLLAFNLRIAIAGARPHIDFVPTAQNIADLPTKSTDPE